MKVRIIARHDNRASCKVQLLARKCENCVGACGLNSANGTISMKELWVDNSGSGFACGDTAELVISTRALTLAAVIVFVVPIAFLLLSVGVATLMELSEGLLFTAAGAGLTVGLSVSVMCGIQFDWSKLFGLQLNAIQNGSEP